MCLARPATFRGAAPRSRAWWWIIAKAVSASFGATVGGPITGAVGAAGGYVLGSEAGDAGGRVLGQGYKWVRRGGLARMTDEVLGPVVDAFNRGNAETNPFRPQRPRDQGY